METIFALSTAPGRAGVAVIRVSGPEVPVVADTFCGGLPEPRKASLRVLRDRSGARLDEALVLFFPAGRSFTGEPVLELHVHGSLAVVSALLRVLASVPNLRPADPGEFTRRALGNGRLDLAQVEALGDLLDAETEVQRQQAVRVLSGALGEKCAAWREALVRVAALLAVTIDFADEEVPADVSAEVRELLAGVISDLEAQIAGAGVAERVRSGFEVAILGAPNVGKSTLLNCLAGREAAITSEYAGTTRDVIEVRMDLDGVPVTFLDTAGLRETEDAVEAIGIGRARARAHTADLRVFLVEGEEGFEDLARPGDIVLRAKSDLDDDPGGISGLTGEGVDKLMKGITEAFLGRVRSVDIAIRLRHARAMEEGVAALRSALERLEEGDSASDLAAEEVNAAIRALDSLVGRVDIEGVLGEIFASFCIGK